MKDELSLIKELIKKAMSIVGDGGSQITLSNPDDCSLFISNLFGYRNWREVKNNSNLEKRVLKTEFENIIQKKINSVKTATLNLTDLSLKKLNYSALSSHIDVVHKLTKDSVDLGVSEDDVLKVEKVENAVFANTLVLSDHNNDELKKILLNERSGLVAPYITFGETPNIQLDPWSIMLGSNKLEEFFNRIDDDFSIIFVSVVRDLYLSGFNVELKEMIALLDIENFISLLPILKDLKLHSYHLVKRFLKNLNVPLVDGEVIQDNVQKAYLKRIGSVYSSLIVLSFYYQEGVFKKMYSEDSLLEMLGSRENITLSSLYVSHPLYLEFVQLSLDRGLEVYSKFIEKSESYYNYWILIDGFERFADFDLGWIDKYSFVKMCVVSSPNTDSLDRLLLSADQVLLGRMISFDVPSDVKNYWLDVVPVWPNNFWYNHCSVIKKLSDSEYFYIKNQDIGDLNKEFKDLSCVKINLLEN